MSDTSDMSEKKHIKAEEEDCVMVMDATMKQVDLQSPLASPIRASISPVTPEDAQQQHPKLVKESIMRDSFRQSLLVRHQQQEIIQRRLQLQQQHSPISRPDVHIPVQRRMPKRLTLDQTKRIVMSARTAPMHGHASDSHHQNFPDRMRRLSRPSPYEPRHDHPLTPLKAAPEVRAQRVNLPSLGAMMRQQPITPPTEAENGLGTLSRAARLKGMKEEYLKACAESFDALHGVNL